MTEQNRILVVEDREDYQNIFKEIIEDLGFSVEIAGELETALSILDQKTFHVALVDLRLVDSDEKNEDGFKILEKIKKMNEGTKTIVLTAFGDVKKTRDAFHDYNVFDFIEKQKMHLEEVQSKVKSAVERSKEEMHRPSKAVDFSSVITHEVVKQVLEEYSAENIKPSSPFREVDEIDRLLKRLLSDFSPLLPIKDNVKRYNMSADKQPTIRIRYWSKLIGKAIEVWIGKPVYIASKVQDELHTKCYEEKINEVFENSYFPNFGGAVYILKDTSFNSLFGDQ